ncbi:hypothetical protein EON65_28410 [archaeon]|nr:MAG: hypothetical protein EON65_28410 [archaeon]
MASRAKKWFSIFVSVGVFLLGVFELVVAIELLFFHHNKTLTYRHNLYPPGILKQDHGRYMMCVLTAFLGFNRLSWALSYGELGTWLAVVLTHICELLFVWNLAFTAPHFNTLRLPVLDVVKRVLTVEIGTLESTVVLLVVPTTLILLLIHGPNSMDVKLKKKTA